MEGAVSIDGLTFSSSFCSGNLASVERIYQNEYVIFTKPDCYGTEWQTTYSTWFYFSVTGGQAGETISIRVMGMNNQSKMFQNDMRPVYRSLPMQQPEWERLRDPVQHGIVNPNPPEGEKKQFWMKFHHKFNYSGETAFFAFTFPYSYEDCQQAIQTMEDFCKTKRDIYFHRDLLVRSVDGRRVDLITITHDKHPQDEGTPDFSSIPAPVEGVVFPEVGARRAKAFPRRPVFFLSARVHPGETAASWMWDGAMNFLLSDDPRAVAIRRLCVFKVVPMLNPDGVARGHYRADNYGTNLNRYYDNPDPVLHPTIFAVKHLLKALSVQGDLVMYIDLHAHATKRGCFAFANSMPTYQRQVENILYAKLVSMNNPHFDFTACSFSQSNMTAKDRRGESKEGSGRVAVFRDTNLTHCYTVECNYNCGKFVSQLQPATNDDGRASPVEMFRVTHKYTQHTFRGLGRSLLIAYLDLQQANPWSRLPNYKSSTLDELRESIKTKLFVTAPYRQQIQEDKKNDKTQEKSLEKSESGGQRSPCSQTQLSQIPKPKVVSAKMQTPPLVKKSSFSSSSSSSTPTSATAPLLACSSVKMDFDNAMLPPRPKIVRAASVSSTSNSLTAMQAKKEREREPVTARRKPLKE